MSPHIKTSRHSSDSLQSRQCVLACTLQRVTSTMSQRGRYARQQMKALKASCAVLQALIGGGDHQGLDLVDMRAHVNYAGGYTQEHPVIERFWEASLPTHP